MTLSAVVITLNEEKNIDRCLGALAFADEVVVLDSGSSDRTVEIARAHTETISARAFTGYSDQKNAAIELAHGDWVLLIDADEVVTPELAGAIQKAVQSGGDDAYQMPRLTYFLGRPIRTCGWYPDYQTRLVKRDKAHYSDRLVHESLDIEGRCGTLHGDLLHYSYSDMWDIVRKSTQYPLAGARQRFNEGSRFHLSDLLFRPGWAFFQKYVIKRGFADGIRGLAISGLTAYSVFLKYITLWDLTRCEKACKEQHTNET